MSYSFWFGSEKRRNILLHIRKCRKKIKRALDSELDTQLTTWNIKKDETLTDNYSTIFGTDVMIAAKNGDPSKWQDCMWISLNINPIVAKR